MHLLESLWGILVSVTKDLAMALQEKTFLVLHCVVGIPVS